MFFKRPNKRHQEALQRIGELRCELIDKDKLIETQELCYKEISEALQNEREENKRLREALEYYADKSNFVEYYESDYVKFGERGITEVLKDNGKIARKALEGGE